MVVKRESIVANYTWSRSEILLQSLMVLIMIFAGVHVVWRFSTFSEIVLGVRVL